MMLKTCLLRGQGLGNQLWVIFALQKFAKDNSDEFLVEHPERLKTNAFKNLELCSSKKGEPPSSNGEFMVFSEPQTLHPSTLENITRFNPYLGAQLNGNFDISGYFQSVDYLPSRGEIQRQLRLAGEVFDGCTISFRGGEYKGIASVYLPPDYYQNSINEIRQRFGSDVRFRVVTDDARAARKLFPDFPIHSSGGVKRLPLLPYVHPNKEKVASDFSKVQMSRYQILSNSSFAWWATYSSPVSTFAIAPKYWASYNHSDGYWSQGDSLTPGWVWGSRDGSIASYEECLEELAKYRELSGQ
jgi:hypothetical protein